MYFIYTIANSNLFGKFSDICTRSDMRKLPKTRVSTSVGKWLNMVSTAIWIRILAIGELTFRHR